MNWDAIAALGELVGAVAVLVTLIYLALQTRQTNVAVRASAARDTTRSWAEMNLSFATGSPDTRTVLRKAVELAEPRDQFTDDQWTQFVMIARTIFLNLEDLFYQHQLGVVESQLWEHRRAVMLEMLTLPAYREWWINERYGFSKPFTSALIEHGAPDTVFAGFD